MWQNLIFTEKAECKFLQAVSCVCTLTVLVGSVLLQDEAKGDSQMPVVINMDGADQRLAERQQQRQLIDEQVTITVVSYIVLCFSD